MVDANSRKAEIVELFGDILSRDADIRFAVTGRSMVPFLHGNEVVTLKRVRLSEYRIGDLIFFETSPGVPVLHRLVRKMNTDTGLVFQTRGDGLRTLDRPVQARHVLGKAGKIERQGGKVTDMECPFQKVLSCLRARYSLAESAFFFVGSAILKRMGAK